jgi:hypothetical protein
MGPTWVTTSQMASPGSKLMISGSNSTAGAEEVGLSSRLQSAEVSKVTYLTRDSMSTEGSLTTQQATTPMTTQRNGTRTTKHPDCVQVRPYRDRGLLDTFSETRNRFKSTRSWKSQMERWCT